MGIIRSKHERWAYLPVCRLERGFGSTNGLGNYERGFLAELREVGTKLKEVSNSPKKFRQERFVFWRKGMQKMGKRNKHRRIGQKNGKG
jgi:hypothetical protein